MKKRITHLATEGETEKGIGDSSGLSSKHLSPLNHASPSEGLLVRINGERHRVLAVVASRVLASHLSTSQIYLVADAAHLIGLPTVSKWAELVATSQIRADMESSSRGDVDIDAAVVDPETEKIIRQCDLLDQHNVSNGVKAMRIFLHAHWRGELVARFGAHSPVSTLKRWRTLRGQAARSTES